MENIKLNLPPFYPSQRVLCVQSHSDGYYVKDKIYTVTAVNTGCAHYPYLVALSSVPITRTRCPYCYTEFNVSVFNASCFAPLEERFISLAEVIKIESPLTCVN